MRLALRVSLLLICLGLLLSGGAIAEPEDDPVKDPPVGTDPVPPKPDEDEPTEPDIVRPEDVPDETTPEKPPEEVPEAPPARRAETAIYEHAATPKGMVFVPRGNAVIGTTWQRLRTELLKGRAKQVQMDFAYEAPQHMVEMPGYFLDQHELSNAQYLVFMKDTALTSYDTSKGSLANLEEVAGHLMGAPHDAWAKDDIAWRQVYRANKEKLWEKMPNTVVKDDAGVVDEHATEGAFHYAPLERGVLLDFYNRKPPQTWPSMQPLEIELDRPVLSVSYDDAEAYAEWAGKHVPTEQEWEYGGRGPEGYFFPWGDEWFADLSHANWGGKNIDEKYTPRSMAVDSLPEGRSWCGAFHMLGNAAEWTSSWFAPYPENEREHQFMGEYVKVIRGATYVDLEAVVLRLAARNFLGAGVKAPPRPGNRFGYVSFRCAWYEQPGRDQLGPIVRRVSRGRRITGPKLVMDGYAGAVATKFVSPDAEVENHVYVTGKAHSIVIIPVKTLLRPDQKKPRIKSRKALKKASRTSEDPYPLAVFHTDVGLEKVFVRAPKKPGDEKKRPKKDEIVAPKVEKGSIPAGTYVLGFWLERLCLTDSSLEFVCFLSKGDATTGSIDIKSSKPDTRAPVSIEVEADLDTVFLNNLSVPVGGEKPDEKVAVFCKTVLLTLAKDELTKAGTWKVWPLPD